MLVGLLLLCYSWNLIQLVFLGNGHTIIIQENILDKPCISKDMLNIIEEIGQKTMLIRIILAQQMRSMIVKRLYSCIMIRASFENLRISIQSTEKVERKKPPHQTEIRCLVCVILALVPALIEQFKRALFLLVIECICNCSMGRRYMRISLLCRAQELALVSLIQIR